MYSGGDGGGSTATSGRFAQTEEDAPKRGWLRYWCLQSHYRQCSRDAGPRENSFGRFAAICRRRLTLPFLIACQIRALNSSGSSWRMQPGESISRFLLSLPGPNVFYAERGPIE